MTWRWLVGALLVAITAVTCGSPTSLGPVRPVAEVGSADAFQCQVPQQLDRPTPAVDRPIPGTIPDDFVPVAAVMCDGGETVESDGTVVYRELRRAGDLSTAIRLLNEPSEPSLTVDLCPTYSIAEPEQLWLEDAQGRAMEPSVPVGECGLPKQEGIEAIRALESVDVVEHRDPVLERPRLSVSSCSPHYSDPVVGSDPAAGLTIGYTYCLFDGTVNVGVTDEIGISIEDLPRAGTCSISATRTATTTYVAAWPSKIRNLTVELDGCHRVIPDGYAPLQASAEILSEFR
ncbi:hypothetical protein BH92_05480 [Rhodococcoides fascians A21d2]|uniref:hypothetical protein n=1 Tax=Rhodococcoides fascians TaxID=1828 RepID=UPI00068B3C2B|nr:hypothetical protein [Rhodococcus fascians]QIH99389.1 hypothetical protein BH92_05480 [Rhodococcus fascians A21d2]